MILTDLNPGETGTINDIKGDTHLQNRLVELGLLSGIEVRMVKQAPFKGPVEIKFRDSYLSIRWQDARQIDLIK
ncbi:MAG: ferrous iron transport protein A [Candidatus Marinimicrobia bacterium]|jgi:Fe2+ transport system protein FeoA|nr:ferrous iron transport protein A [Candidatus Neomarinimicrobiota bacterium]MBT3675328.1 ferrous iron transport protein A [Candidatus Neomarinimicrobiota bacterium]MBT3763170.1 ferrous iron transport protein A [Candidatus Neomarinimicrobiota bacterium]MBT4068910.1 ferrous iron transport protein A [Candidatus Neomarinimicrobiota bacterium]MBT4270803.1 ferrous iron transport protein A [Candidatus Neomarinimicrobiota bacterium]